MTLPIGIATSTISVGKAYSFSGRLASAKATVVPVLGGDAQHIVWGATGDIVAGFTDVYESASPGTPATFTLPQVDQAGFLNGAGLAATMWAYAITVELTLTDSTTVRYTKFVQPLTGQTNIDLDLVPDGSITAPVGAPIPPVISVNGETGIVVIDIGEASDEQTATNVETGPLTKQALADEVEDDVSPLAVALGKYATKAYQGKHPLTAMYHASAWMVGTGNLNTAALQAAADAARDAGGGTVYVDRIADVAVSILPRHGVSWKGWAGIRTPIRATAALTGSIFQVGMTAVAPLLDVTWEDLELDGGDVLVANASKGIFVTHLKRCKIKNLYVHDTTATGIGVDFTEECEISGNIVTGCGRMAIGTELTTLGCSGIGLGTGASTTANEPTIIANNFVQGNARYGIFAERQGGLSTFHAQGISIVNNYSSDNYWGIGSSGVAFASIRDNTAISNTSHGIDVSPGDAGALSYGDDIFDNTVMYNGGRGISIDGSSDGNAAPALHGYMRIGRNKVAYNTSVGIKFITSAAFEAMSFQDNDVWANGSFGIDIAGATLFLDLNDNRVWNNTGRGIRVLGNSTRMRMRRNRSTDLRATGRTQDYGLELSSSFTFTDCEIEDNDFVGNITGAWSTSGAIFAGTCIIKNNKGIGPDAVDSLTVTASPMTYTVGTRPEDLMVIGGTWTTIKINTVTWNTAAGYIPGKPGDVIEFTYVTAPTAIKRRKL